VRFLCGTCTLNVCLVLSVCICKGYPVCCFMQPERSVPRMPAPIHSLCALHRSLFLTGFRQSLFQAALVTTVLEPWSAIRGGVCIVFDVAASAPVCGYIGGTVTGARSAPFDSVKAYHCRDRKLCSLLCCFICVCSAGLGGGEHVSSAYAC
jgi:hypothetical protein